MSFAQLTTDIPGASRSELRLLRHTARSSLLMVAFYSLVSDLPWSKADLFYIQKPVLCIQAYGEV